MVLRMWCTFSWDFNKMYVWYSFKYVEYAFLAVLLFGFFKNNAVNGLWHCPFAAFDEKKKIRRKFERPIERENGITT